MTDKIITTFETTITWFDPFDILPNKNGEVLVKIKNKPIVGTLLYDTDYGFNQPYSYNKNEIEWWAFFPSFE